MIKLIGKSKFVKELDYVFRNRPCEGLRLSVCHRTGNQMSNQSSNKRLGEMLIEEGIISKGQLKKALKYKEERGTFLGKALVGLGLVSEDDLVNFLVRQCRIPHLRLDEYEINEEVASLIPPEVCLAHYVLPIDKMGNLLTVAMVDPLDEEALANIREHTRLRVKPILCTWEDFELVSSRLFKGRKFTPTGVADGEAADPAVTVENLIESAVEPEEDQVGTAVKTAPGQKPAKGDIVAPLVTEVVPSEDSEGLLAGYTFDRLVLGGVNSFTFALVKAIAEAPGVEYNPFYLYGGAGTGKTHVVNGIGYEIQKNNPRAAARYLPCQTFLHKLDEAVGKNEVGDFTRRYTAGELFILDDIQFMAGKESAQDVFLNIFNERYEKKRQIVVASDRPPNELEGLHKTLTSRFTSGIVARLEPPEFEARVKLVEAYAKQIKIKLPQGVMEYLATEIDKDIRQIAGCVRKVAAFSKLLKQAVTLPLASEILKQMGRRELKVAPYPIFVERPAKADEEKGE